MFQHVDEGPVINIQTRPLFEILQIVDRIHYTRVTALSDNVKKMNIF